MKPKLSVRACNVLLRAQPVETLPEMHRGIYESADGLRLWLSIWGTPDVYRNLRKLRQCGHKTAVEILKFCDLPYPTLKTSEWTRAQKQLFNALKADDWTVEDWRDLHRAIEQVKARVAKRHGIV